MSEPFARISAFFDDLLVKHGPGHDALDYAGPSAQRERFEVLSALVRPHQSVLDVGCGLADWAGHLADHVGEVEYHGIDLSPEMVAHARDLRPGVDVRVANLLDDDVSGPYDVVAANGIFYLLGEDAPRLMTQMITKLFALSSHATVFTSLSSWGRPPNSEGEFFADPIATLEHCRQLTPWLVLRHDYHVRDFAISLFHGPPS